VCIPLRSIGESETGAKAKKKIKNKIKSNMSATFIMMNISTSFSEVTCHPN